MTIKEAVEIVCRAAEAHANGHLRCNELLEAVKIVRSYIEEAEDK